MAAPVKVNDGARVTKNGGGASSLAPTITCTIGNYIVALFEFNVFGATTAIATPSGWTALHSRTPSGAQTYRPQVAAFGKVAASTTETCTITTVGTDTYGYGQCEEWSGVTAVDTTASTSTDNADGTATSLTLNAAAALAVADSAVIAHCTAETGGGGTSSFSTPASSGYTVIGTNPNDSTTIAYDASRKTVAVTTAPSAAWTWTGASRYSAGMVILSGSGGSTDNTQTPGGFGLTMSLGTPVLTGVDKKVSPTGFSLTMSLGTPSLIKSSTMLPTGFGLSMALGTPAISADTRLAPAGLSSTMSLGSPSVQLVNNPTVSPSGFSFPMSLGSAAFSAGNTQAPAGFGLTMSLGSPTVQGGASPTVNPTGFGMTMTLGTPSVAFDTKLTPAGFSLTMAQGTPSVSAGASPTVQPTGFGLGMSLGSPSLSLGNSQLPAGFGLNMALGNPGILLSQRLSPAGFGLTMVLGFPSVTTGTPGVGGPDSFLGLGLRIGLR